MEISKSEDLGVEVSKLTTVSTYVSSWHGSQGSITLKDTNAETGVRHELQIKFPLDVLRQLSMELVTTLEDYDTEQAEKAAEKAKESVE
jgi:hypothetical protein